jgi:hypothetical protein
MIKWSKVNFLKSKQMVLPKMIKTIYMLSDDNIVFIKVRKSYIAFAGR